MPASPPGRVAMSSIEQVAQRSKSLRLCHPAGALVGVLATAEASELCFLQFAEEIQEVTAARKP